jgi:hypothetical protein
MTGEPTLEILVVEAIDALRAEHPVPADRLDEAGLRRLLQLAYLDGRGAGLQEARRIVGV